jgi:tetratricopeptide (TPR) repeat protein
MLPPPPVLTIKNQVKSMPGYALLVLTVFCGLLFNGCAPPGPRALLAGQRLIDQRKYPQAVEKLRTATSLLPGNAQAWNYLGLACQHSGEPAESEKAYQRALALDHDLTEAHYNLGCLWLAQGKWEAAKTELMAFTLRRANSAEGLLRLGAAQLASAERETGAQGRTRELAAAEKSFTDALRIDPQSAEALNGLGLVRLQRGRAGDAAHYFSSALQKQHDYGPALLNLAIVSQQYLKDRQFAVQKYREYIALKPPPDNLEAVNAILRQLEQDLNPPPHPAGPTPVSQISSNISALKPPATNVARSLAARPEPSNNLSKAPAIVNVAKPAGAANSSRAATASNVAPHANVEVVSVTEEPVLRVAQDNPPTATPLPTETPANSGAYLYLAPSKPVSGNRAAAERSFSQGAQAQEAHHLREAIAAYQAATRLDPSYFEAHYNLGLASTEAGNLPVALRACEMALAARPESLDARYNFALVLKRANYLADAARQLEKVVAANPNETRANLALGNLYAQQLHQDTKARQYYLKVLETEPNHPQASAIRYWLIGNPQ